MDTTDVLIVGAGPTGLTAATLLARHGVGFRMVDKNAAPAERSKALGVQARTLELWDKLGLAKLTRETQPSLLNHGTSAFHKMVHGSSICNHTGFFTERFSRR